MVEDGDYLVWKYMNKFVSAGSVTEQFGERSVNSRGHIRRDILASAMRHPIFSMARVRDESKVPLQLRNWCYGPTDGWFSERADGDSDKFVNQFINGDYTLFSGFVSPRGVERSLAEGLDSRHWVLKVLLLNFGADWYVCKDCSALDIELVWQDVMGKKVLSAPDFIKKYFMQKTQSTSPFNFL